MTPHSITCCWQDTALQSLSLALHGLSHKMAAGFPPRKRRPARKPGIIGFVITSHPVTLLYSFHQKPVNREDLTQREETMRGCEPHGTGHAWSHIKNCLPKKHIAIQILASECSMEKPGFSYIIVSSSVKIVAISALSTTRASLVAQMVKRLSTMRETWVRALGWEDPLEKEMAIHSSTVAWKIPWTEEPGTLQFMGSQRVGHDWATSLHWDSEGQGSGSWGHKELDTT